MLKRKFTVPQSRSGRRSMRVDTMLRKEKEGALFKYTKQAEAVGVELIDGRKRVMTEPEAQQYLARTGKHLQAIPSTIMSGMENLMAPLRSMMNPEPLNDDVEDDELISGGLADGVPSENFDPDQLAQGIEVEMEHTKDPAMAREIAKDHLAEHGDYYTRLKKMEDEAEKAKESSWSKLANRRQWLELPQTAGERMTQNVPVKSKKDLGDVPVADETTHYGDRYTPEWNPPSTVIPPKTAAAVENTTETHPTRAEDGVPRRLSRGGDLYGNVISSHDVEPRVAENDYLYDRLKTASFSDEFLKLAAVTREEAEASLQRIQDLKKNVPGELARSASTGAVFAPLAGLATRAIWGKQKWLKPEMAGKVSIKRPWELAKAVDWSNIGRTAGQEATMGALGFGALPVIRGRVERNVAEEKLKDYIAQKKGTKIPRSLRRDITSTLGV